MAKKEEKDHQPTIENRQARFKFQIFETLEVGLVLKGAEVKSIREGTVSLQEGYVHIFKGELLMEGVHITPYFQQSSHTALEPIRSIKLLAHKREIANFSDEVKLKKLSIVPLKMYFLKGKAKVLIGLAKGKKIGDKRDAIKKRDVERKLLRHNR
jgi:SsrA-binding protein